MPNGFSSHVRMAADEIDEYAELIQEAAEQWRGRVDVRMGLEADFFPGYESWLERQLSSHDFHYVLGSVHPQLSEYKQEFWSDDPVENQKAYFDMLAKAAETRLFDCLAHPDLIKNETAADWLPERILPHILRALDRIAATGVAMELNTSGANKVVAEMNPFPAMLAEIRAREIPVVIGADAHVPNRVGDRYEGALDLLCEAGFSEVSLFLSRQRRAISIELARQTLCSMPTVSAT